MREEETLDDMLQRVEKALLQHLMNQEEYAQDKLKLAQRLKISLSTLYRKLEKHRL